MSLTRRDFLSSALLLPALFPQTSGARMIGSVPLGTPGVSPPPFGRLLGSGLDARLFTDLSGLGAESTIHNPQSAIHNPQSAIHNPQCQSPACASSRALKTALALSRVSSYSAAGFESMTMPAPAWT